ncbi:MAG: HupE/UreJ family protein [Alphaproteobacteria bacterium]|nr:HupE/UreJ family protein [Alphaproteobacteria bacterium]
MAYAHVGAGVLGGFNSGLLHPVLGLDHFLAMVSVGIISAQIGGRLVWSIPALFVFVMAVGGAMGLFDIRLGGIEVGIATSVAVLGFAIAAKSFFPIFVIYGFVAFFAIFHGYAHGLEIPELASSWSYVAGFMTGTAGIHILGVLIGHIAKRVRNGEAILRYVGAGMSGMGVFILLQMAGF